MTTNITHKRKLRKHCSEYYNTYREKENEANSKNKTPYCKKL